MSSDSENNHNVKWLDSKSKIIYEPNFLTKDLAAELKKELSELDEWIHGMYVVKDKITGKSITVKTPRLLWAMRDEDDDITDCYTVTGSSEWTKFMQKAKRHVEKYTGIQIRYAQLNYYRNGNDYIGPHKDREVEAGGIVASISLGACRYFVFENDEGVQYKILLESGSLLLMDEASAKTRWKHSLPKIPKQSRPRINITFRSM